MLQSFKWTPFKRLWGIQDDDKVVLTAVEEKSRRFASCWRAFVKSFLNAGSIELERYTWR